MTNPTPETPTDSPSTETEEDFDRTTWTTPRGLFDRLDTEFGGFSTDLASLTETALTPAFFAVDHEDPDRRDTLALTPLEVAEVVIQDAKDQGRETAVAYANPPYGAADNRTWATFMRAVGDHVPVVALVPVSTAAQYWQESFMRGKVRFLNRRITFGHPGDDGTEKRGSAPFSSAVIIMCPGDVDLHVSTMAATDESEAA